MKEDEPAVAPWRHRLTVGEYQLRYVSELTDCEVPRFRQVRAGLFHNGNYVGCFRIGAYRHGRGFSADDVIIDLDAISADSAEFAAVLTNSWNELELRSLANAGQWFLHFAWVWVRPDHRSKSTWVAAFEALIAARFPRHAIILMQASPYEMIETELPAEETAAAARQELIMRGYERLLGMHRLPGYWGSKGWLWRPRNAVHLAQLPPTAAQPN